MFLLNTNHQILDQIFNRIWVLLLVPLQFLDFRFLDLMFSIAHKVSYRLLRVLQLECALPLKDKHLLLPRNILKNKEHRLELLVNSFENFYLTIRQFLYRLGERKEHSW
uniref:Uncharacterized protein n=1 Tax=Meloidogyne enterolobii TaxID=390850 RepID=A0A6V7UZI8_MELEN|nr:unnamed protein product [Meloidogyne enterolobii]